MTPRLKNSIQELYAFFNRYPSNSNMKGRNDYKHFLPRIFELTAELKTPYEIWIAFDKLVLGKWEKWDDNEQKVIHEYMISLWESVVNDNSERAEWDFKDYFSALAHFYPSFTELLNVWGKFESKASVKHLANYIWEEENILFGFYQKKFMRKCNRNILNLNQKNLQKRFLGQSKS